MHTLDAYPSLPWRGWVWEGVVQKRHIGHHGFVVWLWNANVLRVHDPYDTQFLFGRLERPLEVLQWGLWVTVVKVEQVGSVAIDDGTESHPISPAALKVGHTHLVIAVQSGGENEMIKKITKFMYDHYTK